VVIKLSEELLQRIDRLESRVDINGLVSDYCHGFDKRKEEVFMAIWAEDCVWNIGPPFGSFEGLAGVRHALLDVLWPAWDLSQHVTSNLVIDFVDYHTAVSRCDVDCTGRLAASPDATFVGASYYDRLVRRDGVWKIQQRDVAIHYFNGFSGTTLSPPE